MKNFDVFEVHGKIQVLGGEVHEKPVYRRECLKSEGWTVCRFKWGELGKKTLIP